MLQLQLCFLGVLFVTFTSAQSFNAVAYGNRVFIEDARAFLAFDEEVGSIIIDSGDAILTVVPTLGTIKQSNCNDVVDVDGVISFENEELTFCYEGGPQMVDGATDTATFNIVGTNGATSTYEAEFSGSDPIVALDLRERLVLTDENAPVEIDGATAFAVFAEDVTELEVFQIQIDQVPSEDLGTLTDSSGSVLANGAIVNSDEVITFNPAQDFSNCAPNQQLGNTVCSELADNPPINFGDQFTFSLVFGEGEDQFIRNSLTFFLLVELRTVGELIVAVNEVIIPADNVVNNLIPFTLDTNFVSLAVDAEDADRDIALSFFIIDQDQVFIREQVAFPNGISRILTRSCGLQFNTVCQLILIGPESAILAALDDGFIVLEFNVDTFESASVQVSINGDEDTIQKIIFSPLNEFQAVAFGNRVFSVNASAFLSLNNDNVATLIEAGEATLDIASTQGIVKQSDCEEVVNLNDVITFENAVLTFCYEGGPRMLNDVVDIIRFDIVGDDGATSTFLVQILGSDPVFPVDFLERRIETPENVSIDFPASAFAVFEEDVTEISEFRILFDRATNELFGNLTDSSGTVLEDGDIITNDEVLTFIPTPGLNLCAPLPAFPSAECPGADEDPTLFDNIPSFIFRIIFGEGQDETIGEPLEFFYIIEFPVADGELIIENQVITVPVENVVDGRVFFALDSSFVSVISEPEDVDLLLSLKFKTLTEFAFTMIQGEFSDTDLQGGQEISCGEFFCEIIMTGTDEEINDALDQPFITLVFSNAIADARLEVTLNGEQVVQVITFEPQIIPPQDAEGGLSDAAVGILATVGALVGLGLVGALIFVIVSQKKSEADQVNVVEDEEKDSPE